MAKNNAGPGEGKTTKAEAVRTAIREGKDGPAEGVAFIKERFGLEVSNAAFSSYKNAEKMKAAASPAPRVKHAAPANPPARNGTAGDPVELARAVKALVARHGAAAVADMAKVFE